MRNLYAKNWLNSSLILVGFLSFTNLIQAQVTGVKTVGIDYLTIQAFVTDCNATGIGAGGTTLLVPPGYTETVTSVITLTATGTGTDPIRIQKDAGAGANPVITAYTGGVGTPGTAVQDGIFALVGSDYVTIDGIDLAENAANLTNPSTMEYGYGMFKASVTDGCQFNNIRNCTITLNRVNNATGTAPAFDGSRGINVVNSLITTQTTALTPTAASGTNSSNRFRTNTIQNVNIGIALSGFAAVTPFTLSDTGNSIGGAALAFGNTIINFGGAAAAANPAAGVRTLNQQSLDVSNNTITNNTGVGVNHVSTLRGILIGGATSATTSINTNIIQLVSGATASQLDGISNAAGSTAAANTININNNIIRLAYSTATGGATVNGITNSGTAATVNINGNTVTNVPSLPVLSNVIAGTGTFIAIAGGSPVNLNMNTNVIQNFARTTATTGVTRGIVFASPTTTIISGNTIENITYSTPTSTGTIDGIYGFSSSVDVTISNNIVRNFASPTAALLRGIVEFGIAGIKNITGNQVFGFATTAGGAGGGSYIGILAQTGTITISNNQINQLNSVGTTGGAGGTIQGIQVAGSTIATVKENKVFDLSSASTGAVISGITSSGGTNNNIFNNVISDLRATATNVSNGVIGINISGGTAANVHYNSVYLNAVSSGALFGSSAMFASTTPNLTLNNNIFINESTPNGALGFTSAFRRSSTTLTTYQASSNRNLFHAGTPGVNRLIMYDGTGSYQTILAFQTLLVNRDLNSFTGEAFTYATPGSFFISLTGSSIDFLRPVAGITTQAESGGVAIVTPLITTDFSLVVRPAFAGTAPDLGAYEFAAISPTPVVTLTSVSPAASMLCTTASRLVTVSATTVSGSITGVNLTYSWNGVVQTPIAMVNTVGTTWTGTLPASVPVNASVVWGVVATNSIGLNGSIVGTPFTDEPLFTSLAFATASLTTVCSGSPTDLTALINNTSAPVLYSTPSISNATTDEDLRTVRITQGASTLLNNSTPINSLVGTIGTATGTVGSYSNFTTFGSTPLVGGQTYTLFVASIDAPGFFTNFGTAFIDYNRDGDFADAGESIIPATGQLFNAAVDNGNDSISVPFTIPASAINGLTRMRVVVTETGQTNAAGTLNNAYGEFEDYTILISGATPGTTTNITAVVWSDGVGVVGITNPLTVSPVVNTTYTATIASAGCTIVAPGLLVNVTPLLSSVTATNSSQCGTAVPTASVTSTTAQITPTFNWYAAPTGGAPLQSSTSTTYTTAVAATTTFYVSEVDGVTGCQTARTPVTVTIIAADLISATSSLSTVCVGNPITLTAANIAGIPTQSYTYTWTSVAGSGVISTLGASIIPTPTVAGSYTYTLTGVDGGCTALASVNVTVSPFTAALTAVDITCNGYNNGTFTQGAVTCGTAPYVYSVDGGAFGAIPTNLTAGAHNVIVRDANSFLTTTMVVTIIEPALTAPTPTTTSVSACVGATVANVAAFSAGSPVAQTPITVNFGLAAQPLELSSSTSNPPIATNGNVISTAILPALPVGAVVTGVSFTMNGLTALGNSWQSDVRFGFTGAVSSNYAQSTVALNGAGAFNYSLATIPVGSVNIAGGTVSLNYHDYFDDNAGTAESTFPIGASVGSLTIAYTLPNPLTITWWDAASAGTQQGTGSPFNAIGSAVLPNSNTAGVTTLYAQANSATCTNNTRTAVTVTINALPIIAAGADQTVCATTAVTLTGSGAATLVWDNSVVDAVAFTPAVGAFTYTLTGTDGNGCSATDAVLVTVNALPTVNAGANQAICLGASVTLTGAGTATSYAWDNLVVDAVSFTPAVGTITYNVIGTDGNGCTATDAVDITVNALPTTVSAGANQIVCLGTPVTLSGSGVVSYTWSNLVIDGSPFTPAVGTITYTVTGTDVNGCTATDLVDVTVNAGPTVGAGVDQSVCIGASVTLTATGTAVSYAWDNLVVDGSPFTPAVGSISYTVTGTAANTCTTTDVVIVAVNALPTVNAGANQAICLGASVTLTGAGTATSYAWDNLVVDAVSFNPAVGTITYNVIGTDGNGCTATDAVDVTVNALPTTVSAGANQIVCLGTPVTLSGSGVVSYTWSNLVIDGSPFTPAVGTITYTVTGTDVNGCTATDLVDVTVNAGPTVAAGVDQTVCFGTSVTLTATGTAVSYAWSNLVIDGSPFTPAVGSISYTVTGTAANTCTTTDVVVVNVNPMPVAVATVSAVTLTSTTTGVTYQWVNCPANTVIVGATASTYTATANGDYAVIATNPSGCIDTSACVTVSQVGLEELFGNSSVSIAPNPTTNEFTITMSNVAENTTVTVFDAAGKMIHVYDNVTSTTKVDLTAVQTGIYMIEVRNANGNKMYRVAKN